MIVVAIEDLLFGITKGLVPVKADAEGPSLKS